MKKVFYFSLILSSCVMDSTHRIAVIKNESKKNIVVMFQPSDSLDDETLFYGGKVTVLADSTEELYSMGYNFQRVNFFYIQL